MNRYRYRHAASHRFLLSTCRRTRGSASPSPCISFRLVSSRFDSSSFVVTSPLGTSKSPHRTGSNSARSWFAIMSPRADAFLRRDAKLLLLGIHFHCSARWYRAYRVRFDSSETLLSHDHTLDAPSSWKTLYYNKSPCVWVTNVSPMGEETN